jgi:recombination protein RecT
MEEQVIETTKNEIVKKEENKMTVLPANMGDLINNTMSKYIEQGLVLPRDYNVQNAVISSYLIIKNDDKLSACTKDSIANALVDMATMGLNASKKQCYFVPYSGKLQLQPSYFGKMMAIKRINGVVDVRCDVIYKGTQYDLKIDEYGNDDIEILKACPLEERKLDSIIGAWCKIILDEKVWGTKSYTCIMTMEQIQKAWNQGATKGKSPAHVNFTDEMAKKSVINRCCKNFVNSAKDNDILIDTLNRTIENDYEEPVNRGFTINQDKVIDI